MVGITSSVVVWPSGVAPLPPKPYSGMGRSPVRPRRIAKRQAVNVKTLAQGLTNDSAFQNINWHEGTNECLTGRFAALRVRCAGGNLGKARLLPQQWLLIEWPAGHAELEKYYLSTLPEATALNDLVRAAHMRWRIERDYQDLGLGHYEGRGWRGFRHHASLSIAAYGFLMAQRLRVGSDASGKKLHQTPVTCCSQGLRPSGQSNARKRHVADSITTLRLQLSVALARVLGHCPHCNSVNPHLRLWHSKSNHPPGFAGGMVTRP